MVSNSPIIAIVTVAGNHESLRVEGQTSEGQPDPRFTSFYDVYPVTVETYLKGNGPASFEFAQLEKTLIHNPDRNPPTTFTVITEIRDLQVGARYMLFLQPFSEGRYASTHVEPARWLLADGNAKPESPSESALAVFRERLESQLRAEITNAVSMSK